MTKEEGTQGSLMSQNQTPQVQNSVMYIFRGAYSIGASKRSNIINENEINNPGPGAYKSEDVTINVPRQPDVFMDSSPRKPIFEGNDNPSPSTYSIPSTIGKGGHNPTIGKEKKREVGDRYIIGPGSYEVISKSSGRFISFSMKEEPLKPDLIVPGPGTYEVPTSLQLNQLRQSIHRSPSPNQQNSDANAINNSPFKVTKDNFPGVGTYHFTDEKRQAPGRGGTFARTGRSMMAVSDTPGPSYFEYKRNDARTNSSFSFGSKLPIKASQSDFIPGPGAYNIASSVDKPTLRFVDVPKKDPNLSLSSSNILDETPGPGTYNARTSFEPTISKSKRYVNRSVGNGKRTDFTASEKNPGPGSYNFPETKGKFVSFSSAKKTERKRWDYRNRLPGPGSYNLASSFSSPDKGANIASKYNEILTSNYFSPGPGAYDSSFSPKKSQKFTFAQELRKTIEVRNPNVPSPGEYEIPGIISTIPSYLLGKRKDPY